MGLAVLANHRRVAHLARRMVDFADLGSQVGEIRALARRLRVQHPVYGADAPLPPVAVEADPE